MSPRNSNNLLTAAALVCAGLAIGGALIYSSSTSSAQAPGGGAQDNSARAGAADEAPTRNNVTLENGVQIITLTAKGGFQPRSTIAHAGVRTTLRIVTDNTIDCSSSVRIPSLNISKVLPRTGITNIDLSSPGPGIVHGTCSAGLNPFQIQFEQ